MVGLNRTGCAPYQKIALNNQSSLCYRDLQGDRDTHSQNINQKRVLRAADAEEVWLQIVSLDWHFWEFQLHITKTGNWIIKIKSCLLKLETQNEMTIEHQGFNKVMFKIEKVEGKSCRKTLEKVNHKQQQKYTYSTFVELFTTPCHTISNWHFFSNCAL